MYRRIGAYHRLLAYLKPYWRQVILAYVSMLFATLLNLFVPQIIKQAIDQGLASGQATVLLAASGLILGIALIRALAGFGQRYYGEWLSHRFAYDFRNDFYNRVQQLPFAFHDRAQTGDLMSRATADVTETERFVGIGFMELTATILLLIGVVIVMFWEDALLAAMAVIPIVVLVVVALRFGHIVRPMFKTIQDQMGVLATTMQESLTGIQLVKAFAQEPYELQKFDHENNTWFQKRYSLIRVWANNWPFFTFAIATSLVILLWVGGNQVIAGQLTVGTLVALISYVLMLNGPAQRLGFLVNLTATAGASASRVFEIIDTTDDLADHREARVLTAVRGEVAFQGVSFAYQEGRSILHNVTFTATPGQTIALIGPTGSGKSTITKLIPRFYEPTAGHVLVDGTDIRNLTVASLRDHIGIVLQDPFLFSTTIAENIAYGRPYAAAQEIVAAAKAAHAHNFIKTFPDGYQTMVGERGVTLSGGQKQRVAIARALLYDPRILILDDSTSSVDTETEHHIQQALARLMQGRTTFIIAQRLLTLKQADCILVLDHGQVVERGTHDDLLTARGLYREIYDLQLRDQEEFSDLQARLVKVNT